MKSASNIYRILLPPLFALCCSSLTIPPEKGPQAEREHPNSENQKVELDILTETMNVSGLSLFKNTSESKPIQDFSQDVNGSRETVIPKRTMDLTQPTIFPSQDKMTDTINVYKEWMGLHLIRPREDPPDFMVQLFHALSSVHSHRLKDTVVTSYNNINLQDFDDQNVKSTRSYTLVFNGSTSDQNEDIDYAELRVFFTGPPSSDDDDEIDLAVASEKCHYRIEIYELATQSPTTVSRKLILSENRPLEANSWNEFDLTSATQSWDPSNLHVVEINLDFGIVQKEVNESVFNETERGDNRRRVLTQCLLKPMTDPRDHMNSILVLFSKKIKENKRRKKRQGHRHKREALNQDDEIEIHRHSNVFDRKVDNEEGDNFYHNVSLKGKKFNKTKRFQHSLDDLIFKKGGKLNTDSLWVNLIKENILTQTVLKSNDTYIQSQRDHQPDPQEINSSSDRGMKKLDDEMASGLGIHRVRRGARSRRSRKYSRNDYRYRRKRRNRNICRRRELRVVFADIGYDYILYPTDYEAYECTGRCYIPIARELNPTKHAIIQTLYHTRFQPGRAGRACCVPTRLEPISVLYKNKAGQIKYEYSYEDMVVAGCGCR